MAASVAAERKWWSTVTDARSARDDAGEQEDGDAEQTEDSGVQPAAAHGEQADPPRREYGSQHSSSEDARTDDEDAAPPVVRGDEDQPDRDDEQHEKQRGLRRAGRRRRRQSHRHPSPARGRRLTA